MRGNSFVQVTPVMLPMPRMSWSFFTSTSPWPAKSVTFQPASVLPSKRLFHAGPASATFGPAEGLAGGEGGATGLSAATELLASAAMSRLPNVRTVATERRLPCCFRAVFIDAKHERKQRGGQTHFSAEPGLGLVL